MTSPCQAAPAPFSLPVACLAMFAHRCALGCLVSPLPLIMLGDAAHVHERAHGMHPFVMVDVNRTSLAGSGPIGTAFKLDPLFVGVEARFS